MVFNYSRFFGVFALTSSSFVMILLVIKLILGKELGFGMGDLLYYISISVTELIAIVTYYYFKINPNKNYILLFLFVCAISIYHLYILIYYWNWIA